MIVTVSGDPRPNSPTLHLAEKVAAALAGHLGKPMSRTVDLAWLAPRLLAAEPGAEVAHAVDLVRQAGLLIIATPTRQGSYAGVLKLFGEALPPGGLRGITTVPVVTAPDTRGTHETHRQFAEWLTTLGAAVVDPPLLVPDTLADRPRAVALAYAIRLAGTSQVVPKRRTVRLPA